MTRGYLFQEPGKPDPRFLKVRDEALALATKLGHSLNTFIEGTQGDYSAYCTTCYDKARVSVGFARSPMGGPALTFHCKKPTTPSGWVCRHCGEARSHFMNAPLCKQPDRMGPCEL